MHVLDVSQNFITLLLAVLNSKQDHTFLNRIVIAKGSQQPTTYNIQNYNMQGGLNA